MRFETVQIEKCEICGVADTEGICEGITENFVMGTSHGSKEFCVKCFINNTFINDNGFTFLKYNKKLFCYKPINYFDFGFRPVCSNKDIEQAFSPDYYRFLEWMDE